jgi:hypothetical protein
MLVVQFVFLSQSARSRQHLIPRYENMITLFGLSLFIT